MSLNDLLKILWRICTGKREWKSMRRKEGRYYPDFS
jgi:hypothetical protein